MLLRKLANQHSARDRILRERLTEPLHMNLASLFVAAFGSLRAKVACDLVNRPHYAYGLLAAADQAKEAGIDAITAVEFGVAAGEGLLNLCKVAERVSNTTGVRINLVGFDTGRGMPPPVDYRDHPEEFQASDYPMNHDKLADFWDPSARPHPDIARRHSTGKRHWGSLPLMLIIIVPRARP